MSDDADEDVFDQLAAETSHEEQDPFAELDGEMFTNVEVAQTEEADLWDELDTGPEFTITNEPGEPQEAVVPKQSFCERCEHFTAPPGVGCTHEGTTILEQVDMRHFRVRDCPIVEERRELEADR
ncbi:MULTISPECIES: hypothetical protein [unclassified Haladaptatus]|uniref:hypothetical protein n=1 Tax=unclassified Haladaptatus TaxID=2622732 RepID=UPI0023E7A349|nr:MULTISPECIES: hypothetical protein [unclassified Haladaptatus]